VLEMTPRISLVGLILVLRALPGASAT